MKIIFNFRAKGSKGCCVFPKLIFNLPFSFNNVSYAVIIKFAAAFHRRNEYQNFIIHFGVALI